ncbi:MAG: laccase domain-containing protein [Phycisphaerae bacterium]|nr:laccase domain-containing protein [Phycisphaerae bacterium]
MIAQAFGDLTLLRFERLSREPGLVHAVTTRPHNYAPHRGQGAEMAVANRRRVCEILGVDFEKLTSPSQVHGGEVLPVEEADVGRGRDGRNSALRFVDGLICDIPGVPLILMSADCPLVCAYDPDRPAVGAGHSSWQGTVAGATTQMIRLMARRYGSDPARLLTAIAPSAGPCCYEVGDEVRRIARTRMDDADDFFSPHGDRFLFNLWEANRRQLIAAGVRPEHIEIGGLCSICDHRLWSHRRDGAEAGRTALVIAFR